MRTGYEQVLASRTSDMFAKTAKQGGKVVSKSPEGIIVEYADGTREGFEIGRRYGSSGALTFPHDIQCDLKEGDTFEPGDVLFYNTGFFEKDYLNPKGVVWKAGAPCMVALMERDVTYEDSSAITKKISEGLNAEVARIVPVVIRFDQEIHRMAKVGQQVASDEPLCVIESEGTAGSDLFDTETLDLLQGLTADVPRAGYAGRIDHIEVFYNGELEDMSPSVLQLVEQADAKLASRFKATGEPVLTGSVDEGVRVDGNPLLLDTLVIKFYITADVPMLVGD